MEKEPRTEHGEFVLSGSPACPGVAVATAFLYEKRKQRVNREQIDASQTDEEVERFKKARDVLDQELVSMHKDAPDENVADIIEAQIEILNDPELQSQIEGLIRERLHAADHAIHTAFEHYITLLSRASNERARERSVDLSDIRDRLMQLVGRDYAALEVDSSHIVVCKELSPREVVNLATKGVKGIVMEKSGPTSHAAIIARSMSIPAVVGTKHATSAIADGDRIAMDGSRGEVAVRPGKQTLEDYREKRSRYRMDAEEALRVCRLPSETDDGAQFRLMANIEFVEELEQFEKVCAQGIGLLRTESLYLERRHFEEDPKQLDFYRSVMEGAGEEPVTIRLFDAGGDKIVRKGQKERNPFLGWRGIRMLLDEREMLTNQLEALLRVAGEYPGRLKMLVPMVTVQDELIELRSEIEAVKKRLEAEDAPVDPDMELGMMVEVPSVALQLEAFAPHVDFFSVGTNDLTQYLLAVDRGNELIADLYDQRMPVIWKVIRNVREVADREGKGLTVCGELASDPVSAACLRGLGIKDLSMNPNSIPPVKKLLTGHTLADMEHLAGQTLRCETLRDVVELFNQWSD